MSMETGRKTRSVRQRACHVARYVAWVVEPHGVLLIHMARGRRRELGYPEAAVWDLVTRGRSGETIRSMLESIAGIGPQEARTLVDSCLVQWRAEGWLETGTPA
jgi:hypothetical protein